MTVKGNSYNNKFHLLVFNNTAFALVGDASGLQPSATAGSLYVGLHTADPGAGGSQTTSESAYTGYARVAVARSSSGWTVANSTVNPTANIVFPVSTGSGDLVTYASIGTASSGAGIILYRWLLTSSFTTNAGFVPTILSTATIIES